MSIQRVGPSYAVTEDEIMEEKLDDLICDERDRNGAMVVGLLKVLAEHRRRKHKFILLVEGPVPKAVRMKPREASMRDNSGKLAVFPFLPGDRLSVKIGSTWHNAVLKWIGSSRATTAYGFTKLQSDIREGRHTMPEYSLVLEIWRNIVRATFMRQNAE